MTTIIPYNTYYEIDKSYMQRLGFNRNVTEKSIKTQVHPKTHLPQTQSRPKPSSRFYPYRAYLHITLDLNNTYNKE